MIWITRGYQRKEGGGVRTWMRMVQGKIRRRKGGGGGAVRRVWSRWNESVASDVVEVR